MSIAHIVKDGQKRASSESLAVGGKPVYANQHKRNSSMSTPPDRPVEPSRWLRETALHTAESDAQRAVISFEQINPDILAYAPIHYYLRPWCDGRYSRQCLRRMLTNVIDQESWHALRGVPEWRALHSANCTLIESLLRALDEREVAVAA